MGKKAKPRVLWIYHESTRGWIGRNPRVPLVTARLFERWLHVKGKGARPGGNWKVLLKIALVAEIRACIYTWVKHARHKSTFHRATGGTEADQRPPRLTSFRLDLRRCTHDSMLPFNMCQFRQKDGIVSRNWGNISVLFFFLLIWRI